ncbi:capsular polysaccharide transport system permease protein [Cereibacter johrii]|uniref:Capsular polysaccharide transport system permease protein n=2 Tax=Cereibacter johrii TaxID=445629 RepID=A0ABX5J5D5_9RHOB|nr:capsular polysaccharide transport system permease protein [Cereibacter johrii]
MNASKPSAPQAPLADPRSSRISEPAETPREAQPAAPVPRPRLGGAGPAAAPARDPAGGTGPAAPALPPRTVRAPEVAPKPGPGAALGPSGLRSGERPAAESPGAEDRRVPGRAGEARAGELRPGKPADAGREGGGGQGSGQGGGSGPARGTGAGPAGKAGGKGQPGGGNAGEGKGRILPTSFKVPAAAPRAAARMRHHGLLASFLGLVLAPTLASGLYLFAIAEDQYTSTVGFSVRTEDMGSALDLLGGLSSFGLTGGGSASDSDILYQFIQSQELVQRINERIDLRAIYSKPGFDPVFSFDPDGGIEDLVDYWQGMVRVSYDSTTGLIELRVHAFTPEDAQAVAQAILDESTRTINDLSAIARADATRYAREELDNAVERLRVQRVAMTEFRSRTQIVDPSADIQAQMGLLNTLQQQLAAASIDLNLLRQTTQPSDPRIAQNERRIGVIEELIQREREKFGLGGGTGTGASNYSTMIAEFERLTVDLEFAEKAYIAALTNHDAAIAEAQRMSRYLATYVRPTLAERSLYPQRGLLTLMIGGFALMLWAIGMLIYYSVRDRR